MKYVFFGTPRFAEVVLDALLRAGLPPVALVCNPDRPVGRKKIVTPPPTKQRAMSYKLGSRIEILQPEKLDAAAIEHLRQLQPDFFVVAAYAKILPQAVLDVPRLGTLGVHPSLLPKYRGASPIQSAILAGETETSATIYLIDEKADHGPILAQEKLHIKSQNGIPEETISYLVLEEKLATLSAQLLIKTIPDFLAGNITSRAQDESQATYTKKFTTADGFIDEATLAAAEHGDAEKANSILRKINAFNPEPGAWTMRDGKRIKLLGAEIKNGALQLTLTQEEGGTPR